MSSRHRAGLVLGSWALTAALLALDLLAVALPSVLVHVARRLVVHHDGRQAVIWISFRTGVLACILALLLQSPPPSCKMTIWTGEYRLRRMVAAALPGIDPEAIEVLSATQHLQLPPPHRCKSLTKLPLPKGVRGAAAERGHLPTLAGRRRGGLPAELRLRAGHAPSRRRQTRPFLLGGAAGQPFFARSCHGCRGTGCVLTVAICCRLRLSCSRATLDTRSWRHSSAAAVSVLKIRRLVRACALS